MEKTDLFEKVEKIKWKILLPFVIATTTLLLAFCSLFCIHTIILPYMERVQNQQKKKVYPMILIYPLFSITCTNISHCILPFVSRVHASNNENRKKKQHQKVTRGELFQFDAIDNAEIPGIQPSSYMRMRCVLQL